MKKTLIILCSILSVGMISCKNDTAMSQTDAVIAYQCPMQCEGDKTYAELGSCSICNMDLKGVESEVDTERSSNEISDMSIYNLPSNWTNQNAEEIKLVDFKGDVLVMVMIYTSCKAACPRLVADMRTIHDQLPQSTKGKVNMILVSIDPKTDTPARLKTFAKENFMNEKPWTFLRSTEENTREFAAVLAVNYKKISPLDFSHSNIISVFDKDGEMVFQQEGLGVNSDATVQHILEAVSNIQ